MREMLLHQLQHLFSQGTLPLRGCAPQELHHGHEEALPGGRVARAQSPHQASQQILKRLVGLVPRAFPLLAKALEKSEQSSSV